MLRKLNTIAVNGATKLRAEWISLKPKTKLILKKVDDKFLQWNFPHPTMLYKLVLRVVDNDAN